jgi:hypothetical protein
MIISELYDDLSRPSKIANTVLHPAPLSVCHLCRISTTNYLASLGSVGTLIGCHTFLAWQRSRCKSVKTLTLPQSHRGFFVPDVPAHFGISGVLKETFTWSGNRLIRVRGRGVWGWGSGRVVDGLWTCVVVEVIRYTNQQSDSQSRPHNTLDL